MQQVDKGGYSLVYLGTWMSDSPGTRTQDVAVKVLHLVSCAEHSNPEAKRRKRLKREMRVWSRLNHANLVPLLGYMDGLHGLGLVSPWYPKGNVINFIKNHPTANRDLICADVASGLSYLHSQEPSIVHGDIKGQNVLITLDGHASICDFGLSRIMDDNPTGFTSTVVGMSLRFSAPELLDGDEKTMESDVYAYGCACIEILLEKKPYDDIRTDIALLTAIASGTLPVAPEQLNECGSLLPLHMLNECWSRKPSNRPGAVELAEVFQGTLAGHAEPDHALSESVIGDAPGHSNDARLGLNQLPHAMILAICHIILSRLPASLSIDIILPLICASIFLAWGIWMAMPVWESALRIVVHVLPRNAVGGSRDTTHHPTISIPTEASLV
ncbi:kinase-like domain-containing protein [Cantharellus anzutake]|uniref:kinase-like domain-containing protein n=1 Tax=Cantharellus anzutake TaxID=1750568 RepID=UPI0019074FA7|nr:kinase-like domain-containing protein [Cantharellus anzutake]KAF8335914.1 kinase-like domain-containing protein [Cantharellus anzutake]